MTVNSLSFILVFHLQKALLTACGGHRKRAMAAAGSGYAWILVNHRGEIQGQPFLRSV